ncbi:MAG TPA: SxtJ family membrane protein [Candidatus Limnocylindrales bacterium]|nr:SxtJ family membrane protein [Candidatus Limnocylindrales bacterium]
MKLIYKEDPKEWRKSALLAALGLAILSSLLRWRRHLPVNFWYALLALLGLVAICAVLQPRWFRGWYRLSLRLGFYSSQFIGRCVLAVFFIFILTPLGWVLRLMGKDPLQLKRPCNAVSYWHQARDCNPLDRLF